MTPPSAAAPRGDAPPAQQREHRDAADGEVQARLDLDDDERQPSRGGAEHDHEPVERVENARLGLAQRRDASALEGVPERELKVREGPVEVRQVGPVEPVRVAVQILGARTVHPQAPVRAERHEEAHERHRQRVAPAVEEPAEHPAPIPESSPDRATLR